MTKFVSLPLENALLTPLTGQVEVVGYGRIAYKGPKADNPRAITLR